jgi:hypothetical protein
MAQPAYLTDQQVLGQTPETADLSRQRKIAELLMTQSMEQPQGQMISGHYVAPSWTQQIAPLAKAAIGTSLSQSLDEKQLKLAEALRGKQAEQIQQYGELEKSDKAAALRFALSTDNPILRDIAKEELKGIKLGEGEVFTRQSLGGGTTEMKGGAKLHSVDGNLVDANGNLIFKAPKVFAPHASQLVPVQGGFAEYNPNTKTLTPIGGGQGGATGTPTGALMPPLPQHLQTEVSSINQQKSTINDVLKSVEQNRQYFGTKYAAPEIIAGELGASKMNQKLPSSAVESRSQVFNTASSVIKERAGTAQSKNESAIIMRFLPSIYDNDKVIIDKLNGFNKYLESKEKGITPTIGAVPAYRPDATQTSAATTKNKTQNFDPALLQFMTPEQQALFK